jgi:hypothetical protein
VVLVVAACALISCGGTSSDSGASGTGGSDGAGGTRGNELEPIGFVFSKLGFHNADRGLGIDGFDLDGRASEEANPGADECAHDDFADPDGEAGIDYAWLRLSDEIPQLAPGQFVDTIAQGAVTNGEMTVLVEVSGVNDTQNDDEVFVQVFSSEETPPTGPDGVLAGSSLLIHPDDDFNSNVVTGRIEDGVLTVGPIDLVLDFHIQVVDLQLSINRAWMRMDFNEDKISGVFAGFWPLEELITAIVEPTTGTLPDGTEYMAAGFTRAQFDDAIVHADGDYNGGVCESISIMFDFEALSAFVVK